MTEWESMVANAAASKAENARKRAAIFVRKWGESRSLVPLGDVLLVVCPACRALVRLDSPVDDIDDETFHYAWHVLCSEDLSIVANAARMATLT